MAKSADVPAALRTRAARLRAPLFVSLAVLLAFEAIGGLVLFYARVLSGAMPGEALHVFAGIALTALYAVYQWQHWTRVRPWRARLDHGLGLISAIVMTLTNATGLWLGWIWWASRLDGTGIAPYPPLLSAIHDIGSMLVLTFVISHLSAVLMRDRARTPRSKDFRNG
jgi:hypothetical protein